MNKSHRDNHAARKKRGSVAFEKKYDRRTGGKDRKKCGICGTKTRVKKLLDGMCPLCLERLGLKVS